MTKIYKILFYFSILSIAFGFLGSLLFDFSLFNFAITDVFIILFLVFLAPVFRQIIKSAKKESSAKYYLIFMLIALFSLLLSPIKLIVLHKAISALYILRLAVYYLFYLCLLYLIKTGQIQKSETKKLLLISAVFLSFLGWFLYFFYPDLRNLMYLGWDPHYKRIFSTFFDPNFLGIILILSIVLAILSKKIKSRIKALVLVFLFITLMFTYSRTSFIVLFASLFYLSIVKKKLLYFFCFLILLGVCTLLLPRPGGVGVKLERVFSIKERIKNSQQGMNLFLKNPILGIGFNTTRFAKEQLNISQDNIFESHSAAGFDNSFVFIAATTGIFGLIAFGAFLLNVFQNTNLLGRVSLIAVLLHSLSINSLFYPFVIIWLWIVLAVDNIGGRGKGTS